MRHQSSVRAFSWLMIAATVPAVAIPRAGLDADPVRVVTSLSTYAAIAREIVGDRGTVSSIAQGVENPHFVQPRPSFLRQLQRADLFVTTGLDLELWVPTLLDKANNGKIREGGTGYVTAYTGLNLLDVPAAVSRAEGDIHVYGNPHVWTDPINGMLIGQNILIGLKRVSPENADYFDERFAAWRNRVVRALVGDSLAEMIGTETALALAKDYRLWSFIESNAFRDRPLLDYLGGWLRTAQAFRGRTMVCYHKEWDYFSRRFGVPCVAYIEPKPGIPPTPRHVADVINLMRDQKISVLFSTNYHDRNHVRRVAGRTDASAVIVPSNVGGGPGTDSYAELVSLWVGELAMAFASQKAER